MTQPTFFLLVFVFMPLAVIASCVAAGFVYDIFPFGRGLDWRAAIPDSLPTEWAWDGGRYVSVAIDVAIEVLLATVVVAVLLVALAWIATGLMTLLEEAQPRPSEHARMQSRPPMRRVRAEPLPRLRPPGTAAPATIEPVATRQPRPRAQSMDRKRVGINAWLAQHQPLMSTISFVTTTVPLVFALFKSF